MLHYKIYKHDLIYKTPILTSRNSLSQKTSYYIKMWDSPENVAWGECGLLKSLSIGYSDQYESVLKEAVQSYAISKEINPKLERYPSIRFGLEQVARSMNSALPWRLFNNEFYNNKEPIKINGLIWMGNEEFLKTQIDTKIAKGFQCIKMKIGALDWNTEWEILQKIRKLGGEHLILRVDANGAWKDYDEAMQKLDLLAKLNIHSIEQPIKAGNHELLEKLCRNTPTPIALDEELFQHTNLTAKKALLKNIKPQFIVLKPSLTGGFKGCDEWIMAAEKLDIQYWITSALEGNIGLNAVSQYTFENYNTMHQGLGTGQLYINNIESPLYMEGETIRYDKQLDWNIDETKLEALD